MGINKHSIPENMSFEPKEVRKDIEKFENLASKGKLSASGYAELAILKSVAEVQEEKSKERGN
jgi:hypothetical protein